MMRKLLCFILFSSLLAGAALADVDTRDGTAITNATDQDGFTANLSTADGQTISTGGGGLTYLLQDDFEDTDGTALDTYGWTYQGTDHDRFFIDNVWASSGSTSALIDGDGSNQALIYKSFTKQTSGKHTYEFDLYLDDTHSNGNQQDKFFINEGDFTWNTTFPCFFQVDDDSLYSAGTLLASEVFSATTSHHIEIELDMDNNTYNVWVDGTQETTDQAFDNNVDPDRFYLKTDSDTTGNYHIDDLEIYEGARQ